MRRAKTIDLLNAEDLRMSVNRASNCDKNSNRKLDYDVIIIGAGVAGLYQLHCMREMGLKVRSYEAGSGVGGTWYWNRYPGARFDSESWTYGLSLIHI